MAQGIDQKWTCANCDFRSESSLLAERHRQTTGHAIKLGIWAGKPRTSDEQPPDKECVTCGRMLRFAMMIHGAPVYTDDSVPSEFTLPVRTGNDGKCFACSFGVPQEDGIVAMPRSPFEPTNPVVTQLLKDMGERTAALRAAVGLPAGEDGEDNANWTEALERVCDLAAALKGLFDSHERMVNKAAQARGTHTAMCLASADHDAISAAQEFLRQPCYDPRCERTLGHYPKLPHSATIGMPWKDDGTND